MPRPEPPAMPRLGRLRARPRRGTPDQTRERLLETAAAVFNEAGYDGTDSNRLARAAGYAPGTFYKHFPDKRAAFLAAYDRWVASEWAAIGAAMREEHDPAVLARRLVRLTLEHHARWRGLRASLRRLVATDAAVARAYREQRRRQLAVLAEMRGGTARRADDAVLLWTLERVCDAIADGEAEALDVAAPAVGRILESLVRTALSRPAA